MKTILVIGNGYIASRIIKEIHHFGVTVLTDSVKYKHDGVEYHCKGDDSGVLSTISTEYITRFKHVIFLYGKCNKKSTDTLLCNINLFTKLVSVMAFDQMLIYTSSSTVYPNQKTPSKEIDCVSLDNYYDISKYTMDSITKVSGLHYYSLRIGTTCGYSPVLRNDLMINSMLYSLQCKGYIQVSNEYAFRPILGFGDLIRVIVVILESGCISKSGVYNIASFNSSIIDVAKGITSIDKIKYVNQDHFGKEMYDFSIDTSKFKRVFNFTFNDTLSTITQDYLLTR